MEDRASVVFTDGGEFSPAIYLHWNGGPESVHTIVDPLGHVQSLGILGHAMARFLRATDNLLVEQGCSLRMPIGGSYES